MDPTEGDLRYAQKRLEHLIGTNAVEAEFQQFFTQHPYVFSRSLPLRLSPADIYPLGRPGQTEPDFVFYPQEHHEFPLYGLIELKRPGTPIAHFARKNVLQLSSDARTAILQAEAYLDSVQTIMRPDQILVLGNRAVAFIILGLSESIIEKVAKEFFRRQIKAQMPANIQLIPYDILLRQFSSTVPNIFLLVPTELGKGLSILPGQIKWQWDYESDTSMAGEDWDDLHLAVSFIIGNIQPEFSESGGEISLARAEVFIPGCGSYAAELSTKIDPGQDAQLDVSWHIYSSYDDFYGEYKSLMNSGRDVTVTFEDSLKQTYTTVFKVPQIPIPDWCRR
jgi:hypothetical protein